MQRNMVSATPSSLHRANQTPGDGDPQGHSAGESIRSPPDVQGAVDTRTRHRPHDTSAYRCERASIASRARWKMRRARTYAMRVKPATRTPHSIGTCSVRACTRASLPSSSVGRQYPVQKPLYSGQRRPFDYARSRAGGQPPFSEYSLKGVASTPCLQTNRWRVQDGLREVVCATPSSLHRPHREVVSTDLGVPSSVPRGCSMTGSATGSASS